MNKKKLINELNKIAKEEKNLTKKFCPHGWKMDALEYCNECSKEKKE